MIGALSPPRPKTANTMRSPLSAPVSPPIDPAPCWTRLAGLPIALPAGIAGGADEQENSRDAADPGRDQAGRGDPGEPRLCKIRPGDLEMVVRAAWHGVRDL